MADNISDRVLKRRQKDLDGFITKYQENLDNVAGEYAKEMAPLWERIGKTTRKRVKKLYEEVGAIKDPAKLRNLKRNTERLEKLANDIARDLKRADYKLQPYFTANLGHEIEKSYYFHAFGIEQAAKVSAQTPLLTPSHVLGVLANPWLDDAATYSDRLRSNTRYLAKKMRDTVSEAVTYGWGWNEAAHRISDVANEGYFNSVRLMRTELNRASAYGASYSYMQNADILDGKRWNATLDSRTAPKDARNDGRIYDLDYDTPANPGVAGQRIPNHPNCRCRWSPVLSATGVSKKKRITRDRTDRPDHFGNRDYTKARTYEEWAKKRDLPSLDKRLELDDPKRYLRPGESLSDLNKKVKRWSYSGKKITVPKPYWEKAKTAVTETYRNLPDNIKAAFDEDGTFNEEAYFKKLEKLKSDPEEYYNYVMNTTDELVERELKDIDENIPAKVPLRKETWDDGSEYFVVKYKAPNGEDLVESFENPEEIQWFKKFNSFDTVEEQKEWLQEKVNEWSMLDYDEDWAMIRRTVKAERIMKDQISLTDVEKVKARFEDWTWPYNGGLSDKEEALIAIKKTSVKHKDLTETIDEANDWLTTHVSGKNTTDTGIDAVTMRKGSRAYAYGKKGEIHLPSDTSVKTAVHEAGHCLHDQNLETRILVDKFFRNRTAGEKLKKIYKGSREAGYKDEFFDHYVGKVYDHDGDYRGREVVSMGLGEMYEDPASLYQKDQGHFKLIYAIMRGLHK